MTKTEAGRRAAGTAEAAQKEGFSGLIAAETATWLPLFSLSFGVAGRQSEGKKMRGYSLC